MTTREFIAGIAAHLGIPYQKAAEYAYEEAKRIVDGAPRLAKVRVPVGALLARTG